MARGSQWNLRRLYDLIMVSTSVEPVIQNEWTDFSWIFWETYIWLVEILSLFLKLKELSAAGGTMIDNFISIYDMKAIFIRFKVRIYVNYYPIIVSEHLYGGNCEQAWIANKC